MTVLAVFRSRAQTLDYLSELRSAGIPAQATNTPAAANVGCGISARFEEKFLVRARLILERKRYSAFSGFFKNSGGGSFYLSR